MERPLVTGNVFLNATVDPRSFTLYPTSPPQVKDSLMPHVPHYTIIPLQRPRMAEQNDCRLKTLKLGDELFLCLSSLF